MSDLPPSILRALSAFASVGGSRNSVIASLYPALGLLCVAALGSAIIPRDWAIWFAATFTGAALLVVLTMVLGWLYCVVKRPDDLRSERFTLRKLAVQHHLVHGEPAKLEAWLREADADEALVRVNRGKRDS